MRAARLDRSLRLQRLDALLADSERHSTRDVVRRAEVCAVNSRAAELRWNGRRIECRQASAGGARRWEYRMASPDEPFRLLPRSRGEGVLDAVAFRGRAPDDR